MKTLYSKKITNRAFLYCLAFFVAGTVAVNAQFPVPDQALTFDNAPAAYETKVTDISGNDNHAFWWTYRQGTDVMHAGYKADGKFGASWHMSGYHICCEEMASPSMDFILLAGNQSYKDAEGFRDISPLYQEGFTAATVAFWFKSDRNYALGHVPCPTNAEKGMHEQEILFGLGNANGFAIQNFKGYYEVRISQRPPEAEIGTVKGIQYLFNGVGAVSNEWQHFAVTYDGENNGALTVYLDGELAVPFLGDPNPLFTEFTELFPDKSSSEIGASNAGGLFGNVSAFWGTGNIGQFCITAADTTYRTGWPASGDYDDFVFYKNKALTKEEIQQLVSTGIAALLDPTGISKVRTHEYSLYPNPSSGFFVVKSDRSENVDLKIYGVLGNLVRQERVITNENVDISSLVKGIYYVKVNNVYSNKLIVK